MKVMIQDKETLQDIIWEVSSSSWEAPIWPFSAQLFPCISPISHPSHAQFIFLTSVNLSIVKPFPALTVAELIQGREYHGCDVRQVRHRARAFGNSFTPHFSYQGSEY